MDPTFLEEGGRKLRKTGGVTAESGWSDVGHEPRKFEKSKKTHGPLEPQERVTRPC